MEKFDQSLLKSQSITRLRENGVNEGLINILMERLNISTFGDLIACDPYELSYKLKHYYDRPELIVSIIKNAVKKRGLIFTQDLVLYQEKGLNPEEVLIPIDDTFLSMEIKRLLKAQNIFYLGDLLINSFSLKPHHRREVVHYVASLGYTPTHNFATIYDDITEEYKAKNIPTVQEELGLDNASTTVLYKHNVFTLKDLLVFGERNVELLAKERGVGEATVSKIKQAIANKNLSFQPLVVEEKPVVDTKEDNNELMLLYKAKIELLEKLKAIDEKIEDYLNNSISNNKNAR